MEEEGVGLGRQKKVKIGLLQYMGEEVKVEVEVEI